MMWSNEQSLELISFYKDKTLIWDTHDPNYFKKDLRFQAWKDIANNLGRDVEDCKQKMMSLLASYRRERSKMRRSITEGGGQEVYQSCWFAFEALSFLKCERMEKNHPRVRKPGDSSSSQNTTHASKPPDQYEFHITKVETNQESSSEMSESENANFVPRLSNGYTGEPERNHSYDNGFHPMDDETNKLQKTSEDHELSRNEFDVFCESLAIQLRKMPLERALICQEKLQSVMTQERLFQLTH